MNEPVLVNAEADNERRPLKLLVVGLAVLLLVGVVGPRILFGGGDDDVPLPTAGSATPTVPSAPATGDATIESVGSFSAKDPFAPLFDDAPAASGGSVDAAPPTPAPPAEVAAVTAAPEPVPVPVPVPLASAPPPTTATTAPAVPAPTPRAVRTFALREVYTDGAGLPAARIDVDGQEHLVAVGQDFAGSYRTLSLDRSNLCGVFLYGDRRFSLCQGEETQT